MRKRYGLLAAMVVCLLVSGGITDRAFAQCVSGTSVAELMTAGPFAGLYKYTITFSWTTTQGLSNITMDCGFGACPAETCAETFDFDPIAGHSDGVGGCTVDYSGEFSCNGNPSIGFTDPAIKFDALTLNGCEPAATGSGTWCFYSNLGPAPGSQAPVILVKNGQNVCSGTITGDCPNPPCAVPVEETSWGRVKANF